MCHKDFPTDNTLTDKYLPKHGPGKTYLYIIPKHCKKTLDPV